MSGVSDCAEPCARIARRIAPELRRIARRIAPNCAELRPHLRLLADLRLQPLELLLHLRQRLLAAARVAEQLVALRVERERRRHARAAALGLLDVRPPRLAARAPLVPLLFDQRLARRVDGLDGAAEFSRLLLVDLAALDPEEVEGVGALRDRLSDRRLFLERRRRLARRRRRLAQLRGVDGVPVVGLVLELLRVLELRQAARLRERLGVRLFVLLARDEGRDALLELVGRGGVGAGGEVAEVAHQRADEQRHRLVLGHPVPQHRVAHELRADLAQRARRQQREHALARLRRREPELDHRRPPALVALACRPLDEDRGLAAEQPLVRPAEVRHAPLRGERPRRPRRQPHRGARRVAAGVVEAGDGDRLLGGRSGGRRGRCGGVFRHFLQDGEENCGTRRM